MSVLALKDVLTHLSYSDPYTCRLFWRDEPQSGVASQVSCHRAHNVQRDGDAQNIAFKSRLSHLVQNFTVTILMEEWTVSQAPSFTSRFATDNGLAYSNVGTPKEDEFATFLIDLISHPGHTGTLGPNFEAPSMREYGPLENQENRERRMLENVRSCMAEHKAALVIVGLAHLHSISMKLSQQFTVTAYSWLGE
jgi:hypothetical protein